MPTINPYEAYSDPTNREVRHRIRTLYGELSKDDQYDNVTIYTSFGPQDYSPRNNIVLTYLDNVLVDAKVKELSVEIMMEDEGYQEPGFDIAQIPAERLRFLLRSVTPYTGPFYRIGQRFTIDGSTHILCAVSSRLVAFIGLSSGNRWTEPAAVRDPGSITKAELDRIADGSNYELVP